MIFRTGQASDVRPAAGRGLAPEHPDYKARYYGDLRSRDAAYHQGTAWAWLVGPFEVLRCWLKTAPPAVMGDEDIATLAGRDASQEVS